MNNRQLLMLEMKRIVGEDLSEGIQNLLHRLRGNHKKCPQGSQWNDRSSKCEPISQAAKNDGHEAMQHSQHALSAMKGYMQSGENAAEGHQARKAHEKAAESHHQAARTLKRSGFGDAGKVHRDLAMHHEKQAAKIGSHLLLHPMAKKITTGE